MNLVPKPILKLFRKSQTFRRVYLSVAGTPSWSTSDVSNFAKEGYAGNPYVRAALDTIAMSMVTAPAVLYRIGSRSTVGKHIDGVYDVHRSIKGQSAPRRAKQVVMQGLTQKATALMVRRHGCSKAVGRRMAVKQLAVQGELEEVAAHPLLDLLSRPNGYYQHSYGDFVTAYVLSLMIAGEAFIEPKRRDEDTLGEPDELYVLPVGVMQALRSVDGNPLPGFRYGRLSDVKFRYDPDPTQTEIFFSKLYNPLNPLRGLSPMEAALRSIDLNNEARSYNYGFMKRSGVPPAIVTGDFNAEEGEMLKDDMEANYGGADNAGRIVTIGGKDLKYHQLSIDPAKLLWGDTLSLTANEISIIYGVPPEVLGDSKNRTYSNYKEARQSLYQERILPLLDMMFGAWNSSFVQRFGDDLMLDYDVTQIAALSEDATDVVKRLQSANWLTINEKREAMFYEPVTGGDVLTIPMNEVPLDAMGMDDDDESIELSDPGVIDVRKLISSPSFGGDGA